MSSSHASRSVDSPNPLIAFYEGTGRDFRGRMLSNILRWDVGELESCHDYIQTLFPLPEESGINMSASTIDRQVFEAFRSRADLRDRLMDSFKKMLWFYGFELGTDADGKVKIIRGDNYEANFENWDVPFDHNHLRITRIIRCLRVLGLEEEALAFRDALENESTQVSSRSREYWRRGAIRVLNLPPDAHVADEQDIRVGLKFLREYERTRKTAMRGHG